MNIVIDGITAVKTDAADISIYGKSINEITSDDIAEMFPGLDNDNSPDSISYTLQDYSNDTIFQLFIFGKLVKKHTQRIMNYTEERYFFLNFLT